QPLRVVPRKDGPPLVREIRYTFLCVEAAQSAGARCSFLSVYSNPLTERVVQKGTAVVALGVRPGRSPTRLRFLTLPDRAPAAAYVLTARARPAGPPRDVGLTAREGRIPVPPGFSDGLVECRLLSGSTEPMIWFPLIPGASPEELTLPPFDPKPLAVTLETR